LPWLQEIVRNDVYKILLQNASLYSFLKNKF